MSLFGLPKCPVCGAKTERTYYSFPFPQLRCRNCIRNNSEKKALEERIKKLEDTLLNRTQNPEVSDTTKAE